ncbi:uncharacterized protein F4822DRAFT_424749 [Hypoxylon trugodes]|uniref:uncharacterized protein n=1 Tax=Hypoxylon trugodes TaxID=326681 RepID=UPI00218F81BD|nr:uncharacterized protein F4822DRAFT_424749 [Hypoxylon trugodes]KAI1394270.1 hypothetical protein F4822DRAFT_424749 [Hypoxylon trugodes]
MDQHASSSAGTPAPYGHACHRLNRECRPSDSVRRRSHKKPVGAKRKKTPRLEEKIDGLISLFKNGVQDNTITANPQALTPTSNPILEPNIEINAGTHAHYQADRGSFPYGSGSSTTATDYADPSYEPPAAEAEECLSNFRDFKLKYFPFIHIPLALNALQLREERPFLWLCIIAVGSKSTAQQQRLGKQIRQTVAQEMVIGSAKNMDLLLGLLAFIGWASYQIQSEPFLTLFTQLAVSLVFDLGLTKPTSGENQVTPCGTQKYPKLTTHRTMEERRAVLACFLITSIISSMLQRIDPLRWTPHMDDCLRSLDEARECPNDGILVYQVRLQLISEKTAPKSSHNVSIGSPSPLIETLHSQLEDIGVSVVRNFQNNGGLLYKPLSDICLSAHIIVEVVLLHLHSTKLDQALSPTFLHTSLVEPEPQPRKNVKESLDILKSWFDVFLTILPSAYIGFPFSILSQLFRCLVTLYRLKTFDDPACAKDGSCETLDPLITLGDVIERLELVPTHARLDNTGFPSGDVFSRFAQLLRSFRYGWEMKLQPGGPIISDSPTQVTDDEISSYPDFLGMEFLDNDWFMEFCVHPS